MTGATFLDEHGFGDEWASQAGTLVFKEVETPTEDNLVASLTLSLYWYGRGQWQRSFVHKGEETTAFGDLYLFHGIGNAIQIAYMLGMAGQGVRNANGLATEMTRRRYWAVYLLNTHATDTLFTKDPDLSLPLPWTDEEFNAGYCDRDPIALRDLTRNDSIYAELVRIMTLW